MAGRWRQVANVAALVAGAALLVVAARRIEVAVHTGQAADLVVDHRAARAFWDGYTPFSVEGARRAGLAPLGATGLGHPPTTSLWILPLAPLSLETARAVLAWISLATLVIGLSIASSLVGWPIGVGVLVAGVVATAPFFIYLVSLGQVSQLIAFAYLLAWWAARRERPALAGAALGAACTLKLFPGVMVLWLAATRRWRGVGAAIAVYLVGALVMTARFGVDSWRVFFIAQKEVANTWVTNVANQSVHGVVQRLLASPACELPERVAPEALALSSLLALGLLVFASRQARRAPDATDLTFAAFAVLSVLASQWSWQHYNVLLVLPALLVAAALRDGWRSRPVLGWAGVAVLAGLLVAWRIPVRAPTVLQVALWRGDRTAHLPLHVAEALAFVPSVLLLALALTSTARQPRQSA